MSNQEQPQAPRAIYEAEVQDSLGTATLFIPARLTEAQARVRFKRVLEAEAQILELRPIADWPKDGRRGVRGNYNVWFDRGRLSLFQAVSGAYRGLCRGVDPNPVVQAKQEARVTREGQYILWQLGLAPKPKPAAAAEAQAEADLIAKLRAWRPKPEAEEQPGTFQAEVQRPEAQPV